MTENTQIAKAPQGAETRLEQLDQVIMVQQTRLVDLDLMISVWEERLLQACNERAKVVRMILALEISRANEVLSHEKL